jgi:hypothetical protein
MKGTMRKEEHERKFRRRQEELQKCKQRGLVVRIPI